MDARTKKAISETVVRSKTTEENIVAVNVWMHRFNPFATKGEFH